MITHDSHGVPISLSQIPHYYAMGWLMDGDAKEYEKTLEKRRELEERTNIIILKRKDRVNTSSIENECLSNLSQYREKPTNSILGNLGSAEDPTPDQSYLFRQSKILAPKNFLLKRTEDDEDSASRIIFPHRYKL